MLGSQVSAVFPGQGATVSDDQIAHWENYVQYI